MGPARCDGTGATASGNGAGAGQEAGLAAGEPCPGSAVGLAPSSGFLFSERRRLGWCAADAGDNVPGDLADLTLRFCEAVRKMANACAAGHRPCVMITPIA